MGSFYWFSFRVIEQYHKNGNPKANFNEIWLKVADHLYKHITEWNKNSKFLLLRCFTGKIVFLPHIEMLIYAN